ncbi:hypothetical protein PP175_05765 [Aneurinibacillus sp. Ricciae_BoGa-3]|uniref:hypothetical protein n=1 Tax=Aneurinibacillus sp. Ricciae_BoGa-3 TaxID=3022697 RepID=UPI002341B366|nr:hypothetical protein [Aneurinibacillus sp. Ricciae_BoGa-3]WCK55456.1 hypothetical protein PP175_05765 [Aneurinibacillus sp. Ricciae_BoGa-3]
MGSLTEIQKAAIAKYISDTVPEAAKGYVTPQNVSDVLTLIQKEIEAAKTNSGLQSAQAFIDWIANIKETKTEKPSI